MSSTPPASPDLIQEIFGTIGSTIKADNIKVLGPVVASMLSSIAQDTTLLNITGQLAKFLGALVAALPTIGHDVVQNVVALIQKAIAAQQSGG